MRAAAHLVVLVRCHGHELRLREDVGPEGTVGQLQDVVGPHYVEPGLVLVHRVEDCLSRGINRTRLGVNITASPGRRAVSTLTRIIRRIVIDAVVITARADLSVISAG